ncbi:MAG: dimethylsulfonioproprionate lyase family protein [Ahrensia sp.]|nr:dimethylsulfonioproprionate lyase family protein [Ahrensia sp.]
MHALHDLYVALAGALDGSLPIEMAGKEALLEHADHAFSDPELAAPLPKSIADVMSEPDAHSCCDLLASAPLPWAPPLVTNNRDYVALSANKALVELIGPEGLVTNHTIRMGVYGIIPGVEYGVRTHPAEELFVMIAGRADWLTGEGAYAEHCIGARLHHPSMLPHATRTQDRAFMSIYIWTGEVSFENYVYSGIPGGASN